MTCPNCQTVNLDNARFCIACGKPLPRVCPNCGALNPPDARFCNQCGTPLGSPLAPASPVAPSTSPLVIPGNNTSNRAAPPPNPALADANGMQRVATQASAVQRDLAASEEAEEHEAHEEERRVVTVLFADLTSSTSLADMMDPEDVRALLGGFFTTISRELHRHGGTVEKYIGDAVMAVFGLPLAHEDDP
ncbi:MAG TPA: zinc-ribbon domain-containing protein, partial [Ktedonobacterales bacterium]